MRILLLNQCFYPDVVSTAQHLTDLGVRLVEEGHQVTVVSSARAYDNPHIRFARREVWNGIEIIRIPCTGLGKGSRWRRAVDFGTFMMSCLLRMLLLRKFDLVVALTSPPLISALAAAFARVRGGRFVFWVMDLNPDEAIAAGWLRRGSLASNFFAAVLRFSLRAAERVLVLDRFMKRRILDKGIQEQKIEVIPPWSHNDSVGYDRAGRESFREKHNLSEKYVVMYSGNHSPCHPLDTLLLAARELAPHDEIAFCFVGGGAEFEKVKGFARENRLQNVLCLPYQPFDKLAASLSAADLHVIVMGDPFVGIVHPCKVYNVLSIGSSFLYIGPPESHVGDILPDLGGEYGAFAARHSQVDQVVALILEGKKRKPHEPGRAAALAQRFSSDILLPRMVGLLEKAIETRLRPASNLATDGSPTTGLD